MSARRWHAKDALLLSVLLLLCAAALFVSLDKQHHWGDDFSVYVQNPIALAQNRFHEQAAECGATLWHDAPFYYVWGYSLLLTPVYLAAGFDRLTFDTLLAYKLPGALCLMALAALVFVYGRRRFSRQAAFALALPFALGTDALDLANQIMTDMPYAALCMGCFVAADGFFRPAPPRLHAGAALGALMYLAYTVRYAGMALAAALALAQAWQGLAALRGRRAFSLRAMLPHLMPHLVFFGLYAGVGLLMPYAASESGSLTLDPSALFTSAYYYFVLLRGFFATLLPLPRFAFTILFPPLLLAGYIAALRKERFAAVFFALSMAGVVMLPYQQGIRYIFNLLPLVLLFLLYGLRQAYGFAARKLRLPLRGALRAAGIAVCLVTMLAHLYPVARENMASGRRPHAAGPYSQSAVAVYRHMAQTLPRDARVAFRKARALSLNTGGVCYQSWGDFGKRPLAERLDSLDYLLFTDEIAPSPEEKRLLAEPDLKNRLTLVYSEGPFTLYQVGAASGVTHCYVL